MKQINPMAKAWANAERDYNRSIYGPSLKEKKVSSLERFESETHIFHRHVNGCRTFQRKSMTGKEANTINAENVKRYIKDADMDITPRMLVEWKKEKKGGE